jgi:hypothetical protein
MSHKPIFALCFLLANTTADAFAECSNDRAEYRSGSAVLKFPEVGEPRFTIRLHGNEFTGTVEAISGYGYSVYSLSVGDEEVGSGTIYGIGVGPDGRIEEKGIWYASEAPKAVLLVDVGRDIYYHLRDVGRGEQFSPMSDVFYLHLCGVNTGPSEGIEETHPVDPEILEELDKSGAIDEVVAEICKENPESALCEE